MISQNHAYAEKLDGEWRFYGHEKASALLAGEIMGRLRFKGSVVSKVMCLIRHHLVLYDASWSDGAVRRLIGKVGDPLIWDLFALREADLATHTGRKQQMEMLTELRHRVRRAVEFENGCSKKGSCHGRLCHYG